MLTAEKSGKTVKNGIYTYGYVIPDTATVIHLIEAGNISAKRFNKYIMNDEVKTQNNMHSEYEEAHDFLYSFVDYERDSKWKYDNIYFDLSRVEKFLHILGNPHKKGWFVHVAGTNGKGSVAAMIASVLTQSGFKTGLYTSPHLVTFRERIKIDGKMISKDDVVDEVQLIKTAAKQMERLTFFDVWTALAFNYFARQSVDVSVIEVGLGGRLDSTNVISPSISIITSISMDHCGKLGDTVEKIAYEKAGIIKPGIPVVSAPQNDGVKSVLEKKAKEKGSKFFYVGSDLTDNSSIYYSGLLWKFNNLNIPLKGTFQHENVAVALTALEIVASEHHAITSECARWGIENVCWPGRLQTVSKHPEVIVDGACNIGAMMALKDYLSKKKSKDKIVAVLGICRDKEVNQVLEILGQATSQVVFTQTDNPRALCADALAKRFNDTKKNIVESNPVKAVEKAVSIAGADGLVIVTGSLYLVGEVLKNYKL